MVQGPIILLIHTLDIQGYLVTPYCQGNNHSYDPGVITHYHGLYGYSNDPGIINLTQFNHTRVFISPFTSFFFICDEEGSQHGL